MAILVLQRLRNYFDVAVRNTAEYHSLDNDDYTTSYEDSQVNGKERMGERIGSRPGRRGRGVILPKLSVLLTLLGAVAVLIFLLFANLKRTVPLTTSSTTSSTTTSPSSSSSSSTKRTAKMHLIIPSNTVSDGVCKGLLSSMLLGYPAPVLINYNKTYDDVFVWAGGSHLAKITGILKYLESMPAEADDDLVVIVDALDAWFQLRPSVLVERWLSMNRRANDRIRQQLGRGADIQKVEQKVIFSAQKKCWPGKDSDPSCWAVPESWMPDNIYGPDTDVEFKKWSNPYHNYRHRWLNSGSTIGTLSNARAVFKRAAEYIHMKEHWYYGRDQGLFADVFGEQEYWRRQVAKEFHGGLRHQDKYNYTLDPKQNYEFGLGVDYENGLVQSTVFSSNDTAYIYYGKPETIDQASSAMQIPTPHVGPIPADIHHSKKPFADMLSSKSTLGPRLSQLEWEDIPIFTDMWLGNSPVVIHHNAWRDNAKERIETTWNKTWFQPYAQQMWDVAFSTPETEPLASVNVDGERREWYEARPGNKGKVLTDAGYDLEFEEVCRPYWDVVFAGQRDTVEEFVVAAEEAEATVVGGEANDGLGGVVGAELQAEVQEEAEEAEAEADAVADAAEAEAVVEDTAVEDTAALDVESDVVEAAVIDVPEEPNAALSDDGFTVPAENAATGARG